MGGGALLSGDPDDLVFLDEDGIEIDAETLEEVFELWNASPNDDLGGLSPNALTDLLEDPFEATDVLVFADVLPRAPVAPIVTLIEPVFEALLEGPLRATSAGYLPRTLCVAIEDQVFERHGVLHLDGMRPVVTSEARFPSLHLARSLAEYAGLLRRRSGAFDLTRKGRALYQHHGMAGVHPALLRAHATRLEWSSLDGWPRVGVLQASFAFSLLLLARYGRRERSTAFYAERWLRAFPGADDAFLGSGDGSDEGALAAFMACYQARVIDRFMAFFGLVEVMRRPSVGVRPDATVRSSALFADVLAIRHGA